MSLEKLREKRIFRSDGVPNGKAVLLAECGRVMAVLDLNDLPDDALALTDTVCLNSEDAAELTLQLDHQDE
jgi:hypothetical protein